METNDKDSIVVLWGKSNSIQSTKGSLKPRRDEDYQTALFF